MRKIDDERRPPFFSGFGMILAPFGGLWVPFGHAKCHPKQCKFGLDFACGFWQGVGGSRAGKADGNASPGGMRGVPGYMHMHAYISDPD